MHTTASTHSTIQKQSLVNLEKKSAAATAEYATAALSIYINM